MSAVTIFGYGCGVVVLVVCIAYAIWYMSPNSDDENQNSKKN